MQTSALNTPDSDLVIAVRASDEAAFKSLYYRYYQTMFNFLWRRTHDFEGSKDLAQELFIRLWKNRENLDPKQSLRAYLYRIANNLAIDSLRKKAREQSTFVHDPDIVATTDPDENIDFEANVKAVIRGLPAPLLAVYTLSRDEGLTYTQIAESLEVSVKTIEHRMSQALKILREKLKPLLTIIAYFFINLLG